jgi:hypothetical protein
MTATSAGVGSSGIVDEAWYRAVRGRDY